MSGWIKLHRKIKKHWVFKKPEYLHAWITIILSVNHANQKVLISGELIECKRGQSLNSLNTWTLEFGRGWTVQKTRTFLKLLKNDKMINIDGLRKTTRLTVCNYDSYQDEQHANNTETTQRQHRDNTEITTNKNDKNDKNDKNEIKESNDWKNNFETYKDGLRNAFYEMLDDKDWIKEQEKFFPKVDIPLSIEKSCKHYWATKEGWEHKKKKSKAVKIDWKSTIANSLTFHKVYKSAEEQAEKPKFYKRNG